MGTPMEQSVPNVEPVLVCRVCLKLGGRQYSMLEHRVLYDVYEAVTGVVLANDQGLPPPYMCHNCVQRLSMSTYSRNRTQQQARKMPYSIPKKH